MKHGTILLGTLVWIFGSFQPAFASPFRDSFRELENEWGEYFWENSNYTKDRCQSLSPEQYTERQETAVKDGIIRECERVQLTGYEIWVDYNGEGIVKAICPCK